MSGLRFLLLLTACAAPAFFYRRVVPAPPPPSGTLEPMLPRREHCLQPPWWRAGPSRSERLVVGEGPRADCWQTGELQNRWLDAWAATGAFAGGGVYPTGDGGALLGIRLWLCRVERDAFVQLLEAQAARAGRSFEVQLELAGAVGPRCEADDPACVPLPYMSARYQPDEPRELYRRFERDGGLECRWDGECNPGQACRAWNHEVAVENLLLQTDLQDALCGCVEQRCQWFRQWQ